MILKDMARDKKLMLLLLWPACYISDLILALFLFLTFHYF